jgi:hypothetical protein
VGLLLGKKPKYRGFDEAAGLGTAGPLVQLFTAGDEVHALGWANAQEAMVLSFLVGVPVGVPDLR